MYNHQVKINEMIGEATVRPAVSLIACAIMNRIQFSRSTYNFEDGRRRFYITLFAGNELYVVEDATGKPGEAAYWDCGDVCDAWISYLNAHAAFRGPERKRAQPS